MILSAPSFCDYATTIVATSVLAIVVRAASPVDSKLQIFSAIDYALLLNPVGACDALISCAGLACHLIVRKQIQCLPVLALH